MVIMKLKEHKNLAIRPKIMEYLSRMNQEDFPTSRDEVLETLIELETPSNLTLDGTKTSNKLPSVSFTDGLRGFMMMPKESSSRTRP